MLDALGSLKATIMSIRDVERRPDQPQQFRTRINYMVFHIGYRADQGLPIPPSHERRTLNIWCQEPEETYLVVFYYRSRGMKLLLNSLQVGLRRSKHLGTM